MRRANLHPLADGNKRSYNDAPELSGRLDWQRLAVVVLLLLGLAAPSAHAARIASTDEAATLAAAAQVEPRCGSFTISTVDEDWAFFQRTDPECAESRPLAVLKRSNGAWQLWAEYRGFVCALEDIPVRVGTDLGICRPPETQVPCSESSDGDRLLYVVRPKRCNVYMPSQSFGFSANLKRLRWRLWGRSKAIATGREGSLPVRVTVYGRRRSCTGDFVYTRMKVVSRVAGSITVAFDRCP